MRNEWPDIPGITAVAGRPRLPRRPEIIVQGLATAIQHPGLTLPELVERLARQTRAERPRLEGLAGWLPLSHVARWQPDGSLAVYTTLPDLALRFTAWVSGQAVHKDHVELVQTYTRTVSEIARRVDERQSGLGQRSEVPAEGALATRADGPGRDAPLVSEPVRNKLRFLLEGLDRSFLERRQHIRASLIALLAGQHVLLLGPPGTAKSMLARALCECFDGASYFEYLLSRFTHPDELFGPVSIPGLKEEDYRRLTKGFLPQAHVAFLDEIFKANSAILNSLLTLINERVFHHGRHRDPVPLLGVIGASNELPDPDGGLAALYDRFLCRLPVPPLGDPRAFLQVATGEVAPVEIPEAARLQPSDVTAIREAADQVSISTEVADALVALWEHAQQAEWEISDRRWRQAVTMLKVAAAADARRSVSLLDLLLLEPALAPTPDRIPEVREVLLEQLGTGGVPEHDLRAQWLLMHLDLVAPLPGQGVPKGPIPQTPWRERWQLRKGNIDRFIVHHERAVSRLATDREGIESHGDAHLWLADLPPQVLARHLEAASDLARILKTAEAYRSLLVDEKSLARGLLGSLPESTRRVYGTGAVFVLVLDDGDDRIGITLAGEREALAQRGSWKEDGLVRPSDSSDDLPLLVLFSGELLDWVDGALSTDDLIRRVPAFAARNCGTALSSVRRQLQGSAIPIPPPLR